MLTVFLFRFCLDSKLKYLKYIKWIVMKYRLAMDFFH